MGFLEWADKALSSVRDVVAAPVGLVWDIARGIPTADVDFGNAFGEFLDTAGRGAAGLSESLGLSYLGQETMAHTPIDEIVGGVIDVWNRIYSHEYQMETGKGFPRPFNEPLEPGQFSTSRALGAVASAIGSTGPGGEPMNWNLVEQYQRTDNTGPGRAFLDAWMLSPDMTPGQKEAVRSTFVYNLISGSIDAVANWYADPDVLIGKGIKVGRSFKSRQIVRLARRYGETLGAAVEETGYGRFVLRDVPDDRRVYTVLEANQFRGEVKAGNIDFDPALDRTSNRVAAESFGKYKDTWHQDIDGTVQYVSQNRGRPSPEGVTRWMDRPEFAEMSTEDLSAQLRRELEQQAEAGVTAEQALTDITDAIEKHAGDAGLELAEGQSAAERLQDIITRIAEGRTPSGEDMGDLFAWLSTIKWTDPHQQQRILIFLENLVEAGTVANAHGIDIAEALMGAPFAPGAARTFHVFEDPVEAYHYAEDLMASGAGRAPVVLSVHPEGMHFITGDAFGTNDMGVFGHIGELREGRVRGVARVHRQNELLEALGLQASDIPTIGAKNVGPNARRVAAMDRQEFMEYSRGGDDMLDAGMAPRSDPRHAGEVVSEVDEFAPAGREGKILTSYDENGRPVVELAYEMSDEGEITAISLKSWCPSCGFGPKQHGAGRAHSAFPKRQIGRHLQKVIDEFAAATRINIEDLATAALSRADESLAGTRFGDRAWSDYTRRMVYGMIHKAVKESDKVRLARIKSPYLYTEAGAVRRPDELLEGLQLNEDYDAVHMMLREPDAPVRVERYLDGRQKARAAQGGNGTINHRLAGDKKLQKAINRMLEMAEQPNGAARIRDVFFRRHIHGQAISSMLAEARTYEEAYDIILAGLGIRTPTNSTLGPLMRARLERLANDSFVKLGKQMKEDPYWGDLFFSDPDLDLLTERAREALARYDEAARQATHGTNLEGLLKFGGAIEDVPRITMGGALREAIQRTNWYQSGPLGRPIRAMLEMKPHLYIDYADPRSDDQLVRFLQEAQAHGWADADDIASYRTRYMAAQNPHEKMLICEEMQDTVTRRAATEAGLTKKQLEELMSTVSANRRKTGTFLNSKQYAPDPVDGSMPFDMRHWVDDETGEVALIRLPVLGTQVPKWGVLPDLRLMARAANPIRRFIRRYGGGNVADEIAQTFYNIWKPTVLLRGGWPIRVVTDEQLRILALNGSLLRHLAAISIGETPKWSKIFGGNKLAALFSAPTTIATKATVKGSRGVSRLARRLKMIDEEFFALMEEAGTSALASARAAYGGPSEAILQQYASIIGAYESAIVDHLRSRGTGFWYAATKNDPQYYPAWSRAVKDQLAQDEFVREGVEEVLARLNRNQTLEAALEGAKQRMVRWLKHSPDGIEYQKKLPWMRELSYEDWADGVLGMTGMYTGRFNDEFLTKMMDGDLSIRDFEKIDVALRPNTVHAEIIAQTLGNSAVTKWMRDFLADSFDLFGRLPTDTLSRQPFFRFTYATEMKRRLKILSDQGLEPTLAEYRAMSDSAKAHAINELKEYLYDLAETSRFGQMTRFIMPFFPAWQEVLTVWARIAVQDPSVIARGRILWSAPNKAGLVVKDEDTGEEYIQLQLSEGLRDKLGLTGFLGYIAEGGIRFGKRSFNLALNGPLPGSGPLLQIPVNEIVKRKPEYEEALRWVLPYGPTENAISLAVSPMMTRLYSYITGHKSDTQYIRDYNNAITWLDHLYRTGERTMPPTEAEAKDIADKIFLTRAIANLISPSQPIIDSPLKPYFDKWRELQEVYGPDKAEEEFLNEYGQEFFAVTVSRTVSQTGIPPTVEAQVARRDFEDLIERYPQYGRLIIGEDRATGEFSEAAFSWQLTHSPVPQESPDFMGENERYYRILTLDPDSGTLEEVDRRLGWIQYTNFMDMLELERRARGLPNLQVQDAQDLSGLKDIFIRQLSENNPAWWKAFNDRNDLKWQQRVDAFRDMSNNPILQERPDWDGIRDYLTARDMILGELNRRKQMGGSSTLSASSNSDLANLWSTLVAKILDDNPSFGPIYYRYLEGDPVEFRR